MCDNNIIMCACAHTCLFLKAFLEANKRLRRFKIMDISEKEWKLFRKNYRIGKKIYGMFHQRVCKLLSYT